MENKSPELQAIRTDYGKSSLDEKSVNKNPIRQFEEWLKAAIHAQVNEPNALCLSTLDMDGFPESRIVLLRGVSDDGFTFFTNYNSQKGRDMAVNNKVAINFFWAELERQVRVMGTVAKISALESDDYFNSRPRQSQIGAWASDQSEVLQSREELEAKEKEFEKKFEGIPIPRPEHWGGYLVKPVKIEFWQGRASRLHDRLQYTLLKGGTWGIARLSP